MKELNDLERERESLMAYMRAKVEAGVDMHAISDCANDIREIDAKLSLIRPWKEEQDERDEEDERRAIDPQELWMFRLNCDNDGIAICDKCGQKFGWFMASSHYFGRCVEHKEQAKESFEAKVKRQIDLEMPAIRQWNAERLSSLCLHLTRQDVGYYGSKVECSRCGSHTVSTSESLISAFIDEHAGCGKASAPDSGCQCEDVYHWHRADCPKPRVKGSETGKKCILCQRLYSETGCNDDFCHNLSGIKPLNESESETAEGEKDRSTYGWETTTDIDESKSRANQEFADVCKRQGLGDLGQLFPEPAGEAAPSEEMPAGYGIDLDSFAKAYKEGEDARFAGMYRDELFRKLRTHAISLGLVTEEATDADVSYAFKGILDSYAMFIKPRDWKVGKEKSA